MTRRRNLACADLFACKHKPSIPISQDGDILYWRCECGQKRTTSEDLNRTLEPQAPSGRYRTPC